MKGKDGMIVYPPRIGNKKIVYKNQYSNVYKVKADFGEFAKEYFVTDYGEKAGILAKQDDSVLLVRQYRFLANGMSWEIPGGKVDPGETPEETAVRECLEETGFSCQELKPLLTYQQGLDVNFNPTHLFYTASFIKKKEFFPSLKEIECIEWIPLPQCIEMITSGEIIDCFTIIALLAYKLHVKSLL